MKLIIQIPCYNEAATLAATVQALPKRIAGISCVETLIVDDGSRDDTIRVAQGCGVQHIVRHQKNQGLAKTFITGIDACLRNGADIIINTDADNQYNADDIAILIAPILNGDAEIVVGERPIDDIVSFSWVKKILQKLGSWFVRRVSGTTVADAPSGFRAFTRDAAMRLNIFSGYTYTLETLIQAGQKNMALVSVPIRVNATTRPSRLVKNIFDYVVKSMCTIVRIFVVYKAFTFFMTIGALIFFSGVAIGCRFLYYFVTGSGQGHVQSLILAGALLIVGFQTILVAFLADLFAVNRVLLEDIQYRLRRQEWKKG